MKRDSLVIQVLSLVCACLAVAGSATPATAASAPRNSGHLLVYRAAKFGYRLNLVLSVDGKDVASLTEGQTYDAFLQAGEHVLAGRVTPNKTGVRQAQQTIMVQAGHTYSYTAVLSGKDLVSVRKK